jgi:hypothetical protein
MLRLKPHENARLTSGARSPEACGGLYSVRGNGGDASPTPLPQLHDMPITVGGSAGAMATDAQGFLQAWLSYITGVESSRPVATAPLRLQQKSWRVPQETSMGTRQHVPAAKHDALATIQTTIDTLKSFRTLVPAARQPALCQDLTCTPPVGK